MASMKTFKEWLIENDESELITERGDFRFLKGQDQDYVGDPMRVLVFKEVESQDYKVEGKTHGQMLHAIKHLREYKPEFVKSVLDRMRSELEKFLQRKPDQFCKIWSEGRGFSGYSGIEALKHADSMTLLNTLDVINDKNQMKETLLKVENIVKKYASEIEHEYNEMIIKKIDDAFNLDKSKNYKKDILGNKIIRFNAISRNGKVMDVWIDFNDRTFIIGDQSKANGTQLIRTMYRFDIANGASRPSIIKAFYSKGFKALNPDIDSALSNVR